MDHPFLRLYSVNRHDMAADAAHDLILSGGTAALSVRAVADRLDMTPPGVLHIFGCREEMLAAVARCYAGRWDAWLQRSVHWLGVPGALPQEDAEVEGTAVWLAICALARSMPAVAEPIAWVERREREALGRAVVEGPFRDRLDAERDGRPDPVRGPAPDEADLDLLLAVVRGLRSALTDPAPMSVSRAQAAVRHLLLGGPAHADASNTGFPSTHVDTT